VADVGSFIMKAFLFVSRLLTASTLPLVFARQIAYATPPIAQSSAGVLIEPFEGLVTTELGGNSEFNISLTAPPSAEVRIPISSSDVTEGTVSVAEVSFDPSNWNVPQIVTILGVDDTVRDGDQTYFVVIGAAESLDPSYNGFDHADVQILNIDSESGVFCRNFEATIIGTEADDAIIGTAGPDVIVGLGGNDTIRGLGGNDIICGGDGNDRIYGGTGLDILYGDDGNDFLVGGKDNDFLDGGSGDDFLKGGLGNGDNCQGGVGKDSARLCEFRSGIEVRK
jgi:Ca2+-binding RTX toxin-like protein